MLDDDQQAYAVGPAAFRIGPQAYGPGGRGTQIDPKMSIDPGVDSTRDSSVKGMLGSGLAPKPKYFDL